MRAAEISSPEEVVIYTMETLDFTTELSDSTDPGSPGNNDPSYRSAAFAAGVEFAMQPYENKYVEEEGSSIESTFDKTFRLSFQYSAGSPLVQSMFQLRTARLLSAKHGFEAVNEVAEDNAFDPSKFHVPAHHKGGLSLRRAEERVPAIWDFYMNIAKNVKDLEKLEPQDKMGKSAIGLLSSLGNDLFIPISTPYFMLTSEIEYLKDGRPNKTDHQKKYRSDIREHAVESKATGNPEFNMIFAEMGIVLRALHKLEEEKIPDFYLMTGVKRKLTELEQLWEDRHQTPFQTM